MNKQIAKSTGGLLASKLFGSSNGNLYIGSPDDQYYSLGVEHDIPAILDLATQILNTELDGRLIPKHLCPAIAQLLQHIADGSSSFSDLLINLETSGDLRALANFLDPSTAILTIRVMRKTAEKYADQECTDDVDRDLAEGCRDVLNTLG